MNVLHHDPDAFAGTGKVEHFPPVIAGEEARLGFDLISTADLMKTQFPPILWVVSGYVCEGLSLLVGRQKLGKTWLAMDWATAVAKGTNAMGSVPCEQGDVLYIDLENGPRRIKDRIQTLSPDEEKAPSLSRLTWAMTAPKLNEGFIEKLEEWRSKAQKPRLVVIDVLQRVKPLRIASRNSYEDDYSALAPLQRWATENGIGVVILHHTRKGGADDPLEAVNGSNGLSACADTTLVLNRDQNGITLYVRGRDVEEKESAMKFTGGFWNVVGEAADIRRSDERSNILAALEQATEPMSPTELADVTGMKNGNIRKLLLAMGRAGEVQKMGRGRYIHPSKTHKSDGSEALVTTVTR